MMTLKTLAARSFRSWIEDLCQPRRAAGEGPRLHLEGLEERTVPSSYRVDNLGDTGEGSNLAGDLRYCLTQANANNAGPNTIVFDDGIGSYLQLNGPLPTVTGDVDVQGPGKSLLTISEGVADRLFDVAPGGRLHLSGVTLSNGYNPPTWTSMSSDPYVNSLIPNDADAVHIHPFLTIFINGQEHLIPAFTGIDFSTNPYMVHPLHTHDNTGKIHVESGIVRDFHLHDFFDVWGQPFTPTSILGWQTTENNPVQMTVNGQPSTAYGDLTLRDGDQIVIYAFGATLDPAVGDTLGEGGAIFNEGTLALTDSTLTGNTAFVGGAIYNLGSATLTGCTLSDNSASAEGGAILNGSPGTVTLVNCVLSGNHADDIGGGAILNSGGATLTVSGSTLTGNSAVSNIQTGEGAGGAIFNNSTGVATITDSTLSGNHADNRGGAVFNAYNAVLTVSGSTLLDNSTRVGGGGAIANISAVLALTNSTLARNSAGASGGALYNTTTSTATLDFVTLAENAAGASGTGGGIASDSGGQVRLLNALVAENRSGDVARDVSGVVLSQGHNLIGEGLGSGGYVDSDLVGRAGPGLDPRLGPLGNYGGPTLTYALLTGSPGIGTGDASGAPATDQRGTGFNRVVDGRTDIGAYQTASGGDSFTAAVFPGAGVWRYSALLGWQQLAAADATAVAVDSGGDVAVVFPSAGVWRYEDSTGWQQLPLIGAPSLVSIAGNGIVAAEFPGVGLERWEDATGWQLLLRNAVSAVAVDLFGDVAAALVGLGVWRCEDGVGWQQLAPNNATAVSIAGNGIVAADLQGAGVWRFKDNGGWRQLTGAEATSVAVNLNGDVAASLPGFGIFRYTDQTGAQLLSNFTAVGVGIDPYGVISVGRVGGGVWRFDPRSGWTELAPNDASYLAAGSL